MSIQNKTTVAGRPEALYYFPDRTLTATELGDLLHGPDLKARSWAISQLLRYAQWDDIWIFLSRDEVREALLDLELPEKLKAAWARMLKVEVSVC